MGSAEPGGRHSTVSTGGPGKSGRAGTSRGGGMRLPKGAAVTLCHAYVTRDPRDRPGDCPRDNRPSRADILDAWVCIGAMASVEVDEFALVRIRGKAGGSKPCDDYEVSLSQSEDVVACGEGRGGFRRRHTRRDYCTGMTIGSPGVTCDSPSSPEH